MKGMYTDAIQEMLEGMEPETVTDAEKRYGIARVIKAKDDGSSKFRMTSLAVDRDGEVVVPEGMDLDNWINNPVILWAHGWGESRSMPIGKGLTNTIKRTKKYIDANIIFDEEDEFALKIQGKVRNGFLSTGSIGFIPKEIGREPILTGQTGVTFIKSELLEFSVVPVPSNPNATVSRGYTAVRREYNQFAADCAKMGHAIDNQAAMLVDAWLHDQELRHAKTQEPEKVAQMDAEATKEIMNELVGLQAQMLKMSLK